MFVRHTLAAYLIVLFEIFKVVTSNLIIYNYRKRLYYPRGKVFSNFYRPKPHTSQATFPSSTTTTANTSFYLTSTSSSVITLATFIISSQ
jgi:hypothetical protein